MRSLRPLSALAGLALLLGSCDGGPTGPNVGTLQLTVSGLPGATAAAVTISNTDGFSQVVTATGALELASGRYTVTVGAVNDAAGDLYAGPAPVEVRVRRGAEVAAAAPYALASGAITFTATGLPAGATAQVNLTGPGGATRNAAIPGTVRGLIAGNWTVAVPRATGDGHGWDAPAPIVQSVTATLTPIGVALTYALATGGLNVDFQGLPDGKSPVGTLFGPTGFIKVLTKDTVITGLTPGSYSVAPVGVLDADIQYLAPQAGGVVAVSLVPLDLPVTYTPRNGRITLTSTGLPGGAVASARVTNGTGYDEIISGTDTLKGVPNGTYQLAAAVVSSGGTVYGAGGVQDVVVEGAETTEVPLDYAPDASFNVAVDKAYLVQSTQSYAFDVPLIAGRDALLRVFGLASAPNDFAAPARARILASGAPVFEVTLTSPAEGIPTDVNQALLSQSWNILIPGEHLQPGRTLEVTIDPDLELADAHRPDNTLSIPLDVRALPPFAVRFVPITFPVNQTGNVTLDRAPQFLSSTRAMLPVDSIDWDLREPMVTSEPYMATYDNTTSPGIWQRVLGALNSLRVMEGTGRYYMGIVKVGYNSGIAGIGYVPGYSTLTWDYLPSGDGTLAHELGHNLSRWHAPCGGPSGVDADYPYPDADIGVFGYDMRLGAVREPTAKDLMSYCGDEWISDYTFKGMLARREETELPDAGTAPRQAMLVVSGQIIAGELTLNPVYTLSTRAELPQSGPHRLELRDASGRALYSASFAGQRVAHVGDGTDEHFAFAIPVSALAGGIPAQLEVQARGRSATLRAPDRPALRVAPSAAAVREGNLLRVTWSDPATRGLVVRDAATGLILTIARGNTALVRAQSGELEILASDGLSTTIGRTMPAPR
jgi:hypothetical protein